MQTVILAAGRGTRMGQLTDETPKALLEVAGKALIEHKFDVLPESVDEVILVVGYLGSHIQQKYGGSWKGKKLLYVEQESLDGTAGALWRAQPILSDSFLVLHADNIYAKEDVQTVSCQPWSIAGIEVGSLTQGKLTVDNSDRVLNIIEAGEHDDSPGFLNTGLYCLDMRVFDLTPVPKSQGSSELGLPQTLMTAKDPLYLVRATFWLEITDEADLKKAEEILKTRTTG